MGKTHTHITVLFIRVAMSKLKEFLNFITNKKTKCQVKTIPGRLETDAVGVYDANGCGNITTSTTTSAQTASADMTGQMVQQLADPNYNSMEIGAVTPTTAATMEQNNTMNVNSAQQQLVMNFNNANNLHFGAVYNINNNKSGGSNEKHKTAIDKPNKQRLSSMKTTTVVAMMQSKDEPNARMLDTISTHLGEGWKQIMRDLGQTDGQIEQAIIDHQMHGNIKEVIYQLLLQWLRGSEDDEATLGHITTILWERKQHEVVQRLKLLWKETQKEAIK